MHETTNSEVARNPGMAGAAKSRRKGLVVMLRVLLVATVMVVPGGLVLLVAWVFAQVLAQRFKAEQSGTPSSRAARALATVRLADVVNRARALI
jgi:flagellar basal body-associated protein FliL